MWVNLNDEQLDAIKGGMSALAEGNERLAIPSWTDELAAVRRRRKDEDPADPYRAAAKERATDELGIDDDAVVSLGSDPVAFVYAWI